MSSSGTEVFVMQEEQKSAPQRHRAHRENKGEKARPKMPIDMKPWWKWLEELLGRIRLEKLTNKDVKH